MKNVLKGWLADNPVADEAKGDKILVLQSTGNLVLADILREMKKEDTGLRMETMEHVVNLYYRKLAEQLLNGNSVNTGLFHAVAQFKGVVKDGEWDPKRNSIYISFVQDKVLRESITDTNVKILGEKGDAAYIIGSQDTATRATDGSATPGRTLRVKGKNIKIWGTDEAVGVYIISSDGMQMKLPVDMIVVNNPSEVIVLLPADLEEGTYELQIMTQYTGISRQLKTPRTMSKSIFVGVPTDAASSGGKIVNLME